MSDLVTNPPPLLSSSVLFAFVLGSLWLSSAAFASDPIPRSPCPSSVVVSGQRSGKIQHGNDTLLKSAGLIIEGDGAVVLLMDCSHELLNLLLPPILFNSELDGKVENVFPLFMSSGEMRNEPTGKRAEQPTNNDAGEGNKRDDNQQVIFGEFAEKLVHRMLWGIAAGCAVIVLGWVIIALLTADFGYANDLAETRRAQDSAHATDCSEPLSPAPCSASDCHDVHLAMALKYLPECVPETKSQVQS